MRSRGNALLVAALLVAIALVAVLRPGSSAGSPEHSVDSDAANGSSALPQLATRLGRPATVVRDRFTVAPGLRLLFVFDPVQGFGTDEAERLRGWVAAGGVLVYASDQPDPNLETVFEVRRGVPTAGGHVVGTPPLLAGVEAVSGGDAISALDPAADQVPVLRAGARGTPVAYEQLIGRGRAVVLSDPLPLCNGYLARANNGRLASDLISLVPPGGRVGFDEYHHPQGGAAASPLTGWLSTAYGAGITWAVAAVLVGLLLRGRAFGPRIDRPGGGERSTAEHVAAVGRLLRRAGAARATGELLVAATRRAVAARHGLGGGEAGFQEALRDRAPAEAAELEAAGRGLGSDDSSLLAAARTLHGLAYPERP